ncbi:hypothetical protein N7448_000311 [Penicillium atrosanguineum]|nr:hypothetical protein N7448_000311 [Penicillium atrosanguineum]
MGFFGNPIVGLRPGFYYTFAIYVLMSRILESSGHPISIVSQGLTADRVTLLLRERIESIFMCVDVDVGAQCSEWFQMACSTAAASTSSSFTLGLHKYHIRAAYPFRLPRIHIFKHLRNLFRVFLVDDYRGEQIVDVNVCLFRVFDLLEVLDEQAYFFGCEVNGERLYSCAVEDSLCTGGERVLTQGVLAYPLTDVLVGGDDVHRFDLGADGVENADVLDGRVRSCLRGQKEPCLAIAPASPVVIVILVIMTEGRVWCFTMGE